MILKKDLMNFLGENMGKDNYIQTITEKSCMTRERYNSLRDNTYRPHTFQDMKLYRYDIKYISSCIFPIKSRCYRNKKNRINYPKSILRKAYNELYPFSNW